MDSYNFEVINEDRTIAATRTVALCNSRAVWPLITELAKSVRKRGYQIRVTNAAGEVVILIGVATALHYFAA